MSEIQLLLQPSIEHLSNSRVLDFKFVQSPLLLQANSVELNQVAGRLSELWGSFIAVITGV